MPGVITLDDVIRIYATLEENLKLEWPEGELFSFPRNERRIIKFLSGYINHIYKVHSLDFYDIAGLSSELVSLQPVNRDVYSFCQIFARNRPPNIGPDFAEVQRLVRIFVNTHSNVEGERLVNDCWTRFCLVKEACQAIVFEELNEITPSLYPLTHDYVRIVELFSNINNKPFSLSDFGNPSYPVSLAAENAAELLATMLLIPVDDLCEFRKRIVERHGIVGLQSFDYLPTAKIYMAPRRYVEVLTTWEFLEDFVSKLNVARTGHMVPPS